RWLTRRSEKEAELREELHFHLDKEAEQRQDDGLTEGDARWAALRELGNLALLEEDTRAAWGWTRLEQFARDAGYGLRQLRRNPVFTDLATSQPGDVTLSGDGEPEQVPARKVTWTFWSVLGVQPMLGRVFTDDEDNKGVRVVVISHGLWQRRFGGAPGIVGRKISLNDESYQVI